MRNQVLSVEQMLKLQRLGIDISSSGMCWCRPTKNEKSKNNASFVINTFMAFIVPCLPANMVSTNELALFQIWRLLG